MSLVGLDDVSPDTNQVLVFNTLTDRNKAYEILNGFPCLAWSGADPAIYDWTPLINRNVVLWVPNSSVDENLILGEKGVTSILFAIGAGDIKVVNRPGPTEKANWSIISREWEEKELFHYLKSHVENWTLERQTSRNLAFAHVAAVPEKKKNTRAAIIRFLYPPEFLAAVERYMSWPPS